VDGAESFHARGKFEAGEHGGREGLRDGLWVRRTHP
jgi:hypothetical protein